MKPRHGSRRENGGPGPFILLVIGIALAACGPVATSTATPPPAGPTPTPVPGATGNPGGNSGNTGGGINPPCCKDDPILGQATFVVPQPGQQDLHPVNVQMIRSAIDGRHLTIELRWWSGVAPCTILDSVQVDRDGTIFTLTPQEGSSGQPIACDDIAQLKATIVDLGNLDPGSWTIKASGDAAPITVVVT
jgi:hypothetical protein